MRLTLSIGDVVLVLQLYTELPDHVHCVLCVCQCDVIVPSIRLALTQQILIEQLVARTQHLQLPVHGAHRRMAKQLIQSFTHHVAQLQNCRLGLNGRWFGRISHWSIRCMYNVLMSLVVGFDLFLYRINLNKKYAIIKQRSKQQLL